MPADRQEQIDCEPLVDNIGELELDLEDRNQEPQIEEKQKRLEQIVPEIVPKFLKNRHFGGRLGTLAFLESDLGRHEGVIDDDSPSGFEIPEIDILPDALAQANPD